MNINRTPPMTRRSFIRSALLASALPVMTHAAEKTPRLRIAPFHVVVTPPVGHPLCGGWITPVVDCEDGLEAIGYVLLGAGQPIVVCAVDWTGILNAAHVAWRTALAEAAGTTLDRVAVHCVHQHDAPFVCLQAEKFVAEPQGGLHVVGVEFFNQCLDRARAAVKAALPKSRRVTHISTGEAKVEKVASNRRVEIGPDGKVKRMRGSSCKDANLVAMPEGLIDPQLKTVAFYDGRKKILACHYYATHPMSHYGSGHVSSDFVGLARKRRQQDEPNCTHIYFTGAAGNIAAGKYNDGSDEAKIQLTQRIYDGIVTSEKSMKRLRINKVLWRTHEMLPPVNPLFNSGELNSKMANKRNSAVDRILPAMKLSWMQRVTEGTPIVLSALHVNDVTLLHLPAESFVEYQLRAQQIGCGRFVATAAYGDGGPWYIPVREAYPQGGYEVSVANCADVVDDILTRGIKDLLAV